MTTSYPDDDRVADALAARLRACQLDEEEWPALQHIVFGEEGGTASPDELSMAAEVTGELLALFTAAIKTYRDSIPFVEVIGEDEVGLCHVAVARVLVSSFVLPHTALPPFVIRTHIHSSPPRVQLYATA